jgi:hypothetical protein
MASNPSLEDLAASIQDLILSQQSFQTHVVDEIHGLRARLGPPGFPLNVPTVTIPATSIKLAYHVLMAPIRWVGSSRSTNSLTIT